MNLIINIMTISVLSVPLAVEPSLQHRCSVNQQGIQRWINGHFVKIAYGSAGVRNVISTNLSTRIMAEANRFKLDPLVMATIAWIESDYRPSRRGRFTGVGRRRNEIGIWQLIPGDWPVREANKAILGCRPGPRVNRWQWARWRRLYRWKPCAAQDVANQRAKAGWFGTDELASFYVGTWIAAFEMRSHIDSCKKRAPQGHTYRKLPWWNSWRAKNPNVNITALERYLHYNFGSRFYSNGSYHKKLFLRYPKVRKGICGF